MPADGDSAMRFMVLIKASADSEAGVMPSEELLSAMGKFNQELIDAGVMLAGDGLKPSSQGARVNFNGDKRSVTDGPFAETKELIAGYWLWQCKDLEEAIAWVKQCPNPMGEDCHIEIRPLYEIEDFDTEQAPAFKAQEKQLRDAAAKRS